jgi:hypothetical protein
MPAQRNGFRLKLGVVLGGYLAAFALASAAVAVRVAGTSGPDAQASSGMYAFGDSVLFAAVFGAVALLPTGIGLVFLRPYRRFWTVLSAVAAFIAATVIAAFILYVVGRTEPVSSSLGAWSAFSVLRILAAPLFAAAFFLAGIISPFRAPRWLLVAAAAGEIAVFACTGFFWFASL